MTRYVRLIVTMAAIAWGCLTTGACVHPDDFEIVGECIDVEFCTSVMDAGYAIALEAPEGAGGDYIDSEGVQYHNVIVCYGGNKKIKIGNKVEGRVYEDPGYSTAYCNFHFRDSRGDVPECIFTQIDKEVKE